MNPRAAMIFAAGLGTRMGTLTRDRPKPLIPVAGRALIDHALALTEPFHLLRRVVNVHYRAAMIRAHIAGRDIAISDETERLLETGGGLRHALPLLGDGPVFTLNSDAVWTGANPLQALDAAWKPDDEALLLLVPRGEAIGHSGGGDFSIDSQGRLSRGGGLVYTGVQIMRTGGLLAIPEPVFSLNRLWDAAAGRGRLRGLIHTGGWCDVGRPESIALAEELLGHVH